MKTAMFSGFKRDIRYVVKLKTVLNGKTNFQVAEEINYRT